MASAAHRFFLLASLLICIFLLLHRRSLRLPLQGLCLFRANYYFVYHAELVLTSGRVAVVFASLMMFNVVNGALFMGTSVHGGVVVGGLLGMAAVFWSEFNTLDLSDANFVVVLLFCLAGTLLASCGNIIAARNRTHNLSVLVTNAWAMGYGAVIMYLAALVMGVPITIGGACPTLRRCTWWCLVRLSPSGLSSP